MKATIVWFRRDLRLADNSAWAKACAVGNPVIPVFILPDSARELNDPGTVSSWWLHKALEDLRHQLEQIGSYLVVLDGNPLNAIIGLIAQCDVDLVVWNRCYEPSLIEDEQKVELNLKEKGISTWVGSSCLLVEPDELFNKQGTPYKVFSAFFRGWNDRIRTDSFRDGDMQDALPPAQEKISWENGSLPGIEVKDFDGSVHDPTRAGAKTSLKCFLQNCLEDYETNRDFPSRNGTSQLSAALHWGQIGPGEIMAALSKSHQSAGKKKFVSELAWREFAYYILYHFPYTKDGPFRKEYQSFPWRSDSKELQAWKLGRTGYPIVDAAMRQLKKTGWINNRVRMLVASFLVKHLMHSWSEGAEWFMEKLVDADLANNTLGWQWVAGCGVDAAPFFRIFNPVTQGKKFDPDGQYIRDHLPELANVPRKYVHEPWLMPDELQKSSGCLIGEDYPEPICSLMHGRIRALSAWKEFK